MAQEPVIQIDNSAKSRILRLFKFLYEANRLRNRPERTLQDQVTVIPLTGLPEHPSLQLVRPVAAEGQPPAEFEFRIARARTTRCAEPPPALRDWLISGWDDPIKSAAHVESLNKTNDEGESTTMAFSDDPERTSAWERWIAIRDAWVEPEIRARAALAFFERIYELYALLEKEGERLELVVADGLLNWQIRSVMENADVQIHHPILLKRIELSFDASKPEFIFSDTDRETEIYTSLLIDLEGLNASGIDARQRELASAGYHPLGFADAQAFMTALVQTISPTRGEFLEEKGNDFDAHPRLWRDPVLLVRRRVQGVTNAISRIIDDIEAKEVFPPAFGQIVGMPTDWQDVSVGQGAPGNGADSTTKSVSIDDDEILLAKETNEEQMQIIRRLATSGSVLVQGPPGTGKTHTIGNIIGHLLAQGKSVLVTSHTPKALRVLRDQIPEDLRPLCVSAVGGDRESRRQLETAITEINARLARSSVEVLRGQIDDRVKERRKLLEENRRLTAKLREALESEYQEILSLGKAIMPAEAARYVKKHTPASSWLPGPLTANTVLPLTTEDLASLYATNAAFDVTEERDASYILPALDGLMPVAQFRSQVTNIETLLASDLAFKAEAWSPTATATSEQLGQLLTALETEFAEHYRKLAWRPHAIVAGIQGGTRRKVWETLASKIMEASELSAQHSLSLHHRPTLSNELSLDKQCEILEQLLVYVGEGGKLGIVQLITKSEWKRLINTSGVSAGRPQREEHFRALSLLANLSRLREEIADLWDKLITAHGGSPFNDMGPEPEQSARSLVQEIHRCLNWNLAVWLGLLNRLESYGLDLDKALGSVPRHASLTSDYDFAEEASIKVLPPILEAQIRRLHLKECERDLARHVEALIDMREERGSVARLIAAIQARDFRQYVEAFEYVRRLQEISPMAKARRALLDLLSKAAPIWASAIANRVAPHHASLLPGDVTVSWACRQLHEELDRRNALDAQALQRQIDYNRTVLREVTISLIDLRAWVTQLERVQANHTVRQALVGWLDVIKKIKSTQKKDLLWRLKTEARNLMKLSAKAVPVWIMPLAAAAENFDPALTRFDVVIIDEASQADLNALVAIYQADKAIIVGDHEQVTPEAVGKDQSLVHNLIDTYLRDIPNSRLFDNRFSIYDIGRQSFGDAICLLEHFRCVPEIIAFSNRLSYDGRIKPLRETNSTHIKPGCVAYRVHGVAQNQINLKEAETIVDLIKAMCKHPAYAGKTIGVISMVGEGQAYLIDSKLRKELDPVEYERRRIICGNSAQFQGDERHIVFLSMIDSGKEHGMGPIAKKGEGAFESTKKRYNVAASRAQDQLWVVYSLDPDNDLKPEDLRRELILHAKNPMSTMRLFKQEERRTESEFERQVLRILVNKGFKVRSQWSVGYYRIDMVVEGIGKRLAVECDGDRWHPIEKLSDDMARQAILERLGWKFVRIRGSAFFRDEEQAMRAVFERLDELGIAPDLRTEDASEDASLIRELEAIIAAGPDGDEPEPDPEPANVGPSTPPPAARSKPFERKESNQKTDPPRPFPIPSIQHEGSQDDPAEMEDIRPQQAASTFSRPPFAPYVSYEGTHSDDPRNVGLEIVAEGLCRIIDTEGPVVAKRIYDIYLRGCGIKRMGHELKSTMNKSLQYAIRQGRAIAEDELRKGGLLYSVIRAKNAQPIKLRDRGTRALEEIPPSELQTVAKYLQMRHGFEQGTEDHCRAILECFDLKRLTTQVSNSLAEILERHYPYVDDYLKRIDV